MSTTLRLIMPQWQGGNNPSYSLGAELLAWLAPKNDNAVEIKVPIKPFENKDLPMENGIAGRSILLEQLESAGNLIKAHNPDKIIVFGGDCLVSQAPFAYLNEKYDENLGVLWLDAHPDISTPKMHNHEHAMVLGNLLGHGDKEFAEKVKAPIRKDLVMYGGLQKMTPEEEKVVKELNLKWASPSELSENSDKILKWIKEKNIKHLAIHLDLDVLDPKLFRSLLFANPNGEIISASEGEMTLPQISRIINDVSLETDVVGLTFAEHLPWDDINLKSFLDSLPVFK